MKHTCLACNTEVEGVADKDFTRAPKEGDFTVCGWCGTLGRFNKDLNAVAIDMREQWEIFMRRPEMYAKMLKIQFQVLDKINGKE
jgi:hypothetical protein